MRVVDLVDLQEMGSRFFEGNPGVTEVFRVEVQPHFWSFQE